MKEEEPELQSTLEKLCELQEQFEKGDLSDRALTIKLARLDEELRQKTEQLEQVTKELEELAEKAHEDRLTQADKLRKVSRSRINGIGLQQ
ncbi:MAG: hypothetical protein M2R45_03102 [Verrucomicrobia subdivision 3 bacterium]|nr:hypothetical protein [Limisphaerales bacterium]MCS1413170.1 hypothetical protein [Limisphaerales bacterium]